MLIQMNRKIFQSGFGFSPHRLVFDFNAPSAAAAPSNDKDKTVLTEAAKAASERTSEQLRKAAVERGKSKARATVGEGAPAKPALPPIPDKMKGMKLEGQVKKNSNGTVEQPFKFGDLGIPGRIIMPEKPEAGKKTTIIFNYVDDPGKSADSEKKILEQLKKSKTDLGNTVVVTLRTPEGTTMVDKQRVDTMAALMGDLERFQADLNKNDKTKNINLARAETVLHMTSAEEGPKVQRLLRQYQTHAAETDMRATDIAGIIDNDPDHLVENLEAVLTKMKSDSEQKDTSNPSTGTDTTPTGTPAGSMGSSGGGGYSGGGGGGGEQPSATTEVTTSDASTAGSPETTEPTKEEAASDSPSEQLEVNAEGIDKLLIVGDSMFEVVQKRVLSHYGAQHVEATAVRSKHIATMVGELKARERQLDKLNTEICRGTILVNGGVNDIAAGKTADEIFRHMQEMVEIAKAHHLKIIFCALAPFGDTTYPSLQNGMEQKNKERIEANRKLYALAADNKETVGVIPLDKKYSEGGFADDQDTNKLHADVRSGDGLHPSGKGTVVLQAAILKYLGEVKTSKSTPEPVNPTEPAKDTPPGTTPAVPLSGGATESPNTKPASSTPAISLRPAKEKSPEFYQFASQVNQSFITEGAKPGTTKRVEYKGKEYIAKFTIHHLQARTGKTGTFQATEMYEENATA